MAGEGYAGRKMLTDHIETCAGDSADMLGRCAFHAQTWGLLSWWRAFLGSRPSCRGGILRRCPLLRKRWSLWVGSRLTATGVQVLASRRKPVACRSSRSLSPTASDQSVYGRNWAAQRRRLYYWQGCGLFPTNFQPTKVWSLGETSSSGNKNNA